MERNENCTDPVGIPVLTQKRNVNTNYVILGPIFCLNFLSGEKIQVETASSVSLSDRSSQVEQLYSDYTTECQRESIKWKKLP